MGFVRSESESDTETSLTPRDDEEAGNGRLSSPLLKTPTGKSSKLFSTRRRGMSETEEILEELEDDALTEMFSPSISQHRRISSVRSTPSREPRDKGEGQRQPTESTSLISSGTGRSHRDRRRRSAPSLGRRRSGEESQEALGGWWKMKWWRDKAGRRTRTNGGDGTTRSG